jgi:hypothetical protein
MRASICRSLFWALSLVVLPTWTYAVTCTDTCDSPPCRQNVTTCAAPNENACDYYDETWGEASGWYCWRVKSVVAGTCNRCQYHFSCAFHACENFSTDYRDFELVHCPSQVAGPAEGCNDNVEDLNTGFDCCS